MLRSTLKSCESYFNDIVATAKKLDVTRPMTLVTMVPVSYDFSLKNIDIVGVNRYPAWYSDTGHTELIQRQLGAGVCLYVSEAKYNLLTGGDNLVFTWNKVCLRYSNNSKWKRLSPSSRMTQTYRTLSKKLLEFPWRSSTCSKN